MDKTIGCFNYRKTLNGNLLGEFTNNKTDEILTDSSKLIDNEDFQDIKGLYITVWQENGVNISLELKISEIGKNKYVFEWKNKKGQNIFQGQGYRSDNNMIIGFYSSI